MARLQRDVADQRPRRPKFTPMGAWGIPAINTALLLSSGATVTWAHWGLLRNNRSHLILGLAATVLLGTLFLGFQAYEYYHAYTELGLTMGAGAYGATFFMLTGFHGFHVTLGTIMLLVILLRSMSGHFTAERHFAFEGRRLVLALRRCGLADPVRLCLLGITGNEAEPETDQQTAGKAKWTVRCARSAHALS